VPSESSWPEEVRGACRSIENDALLNSGTEADHGGRALARAATGRELIVKFDGCYHATPMASREGGPG